jgi:hypothetical protein
MREESRAQSLLKKNKKVFEKRLGYMKKVSYICIIDLRPKGDERYSVTQIENVL